MHLAVNDRRCCLGVAGDRLTMVNPVRFAWEADTDDDGYTQQCLVDKLPPMDHGHRDCYILPYGALTTFGFANSEQAQFAGLNDHAGLTFAQIADVIDYLVDNSTDLAELMQRIPDMPIREEDDNI